MVKLMCTSQIAMSYDVLLFLKCRYPTISHNVQKVILYIIVVIIVLLNIHMNWVFANLILKNLNKKEIGTALVHMGDDC